MRSSVVSRSQVEVEGVRVKWLREGTPRGKTRRERSNVQGTGGLEGEPGPTIFVVDGGQ